MALTFRRLEVFVAVAEDGNFRKAAERLGISQPSVSSQIKSMERYLGYQLFERHRGALAALSAEGKSFLAQARDLVAAQNALACARLGGTRLVPLQLKVLIGPLLLRALRGAGAGRIPAGESAYRPAGAAFFFRHGRGGSFSPRRSRRDAVHRRAARMQRRRDRRGDLPDQLFAVWRARRWCGRCCRDNGRWTSCPSCCWRSTSASRSGRWTSSPARESFRARSCHPRPQSLDHLLQMVLAGRGVGMFFDIEIASHMRSGRVLPCGPALDPVSRVMVVGPRARAADAAPLLAFLRHAVRKDDEAIATQHARLGHPGTVGWRRQPGPLGRVVI